MLQYSCTKEPCIKNSHSSCQRPGFVGFLQTQKANLPQNSDTHLQRFRASGFRFNKGGHSAHTLPRLHVIPVGDDAVLDGIPWLWFWSLSGV